MRPTAFTLLELVACLLIAALLAAAATLSLTGAHRSVEMDDVVERIAHFQWQVRTHAQRFGKPEHLVVDLAKNRLVVQAGNGGQSPRGPRRIFEVPAGYRLTAVQTVDAEVTSGQISLPCSSRGITPDHALRVRGRHGEARWLIIAGLTGQVIELEDSDAVERAMDLLQPSKQTVSGGNDAH